MKVKIMYGSRSHRLQNDVGSSQRKAQTKYLYFHPRMCKRVSCNVFKALVLAILLPFYANAQDTDSTTVAQPDSAATAPEKPAAKPDASGVTSAFENTFSIITLVLPHNSLRNSKTLHNWPFIAFSVPGWALNFNIQKNMGTMQLV